jgi:hypothetical protein
MKQLSIFIVFIFFVSNLYAWDNNNNNSENFIEFQESDFSSEFKELDLSMCQNGYKKIDNTCQKIYVPNNAIAVGDIWMCKNGFEKIGNECRKFSVPINAVAVGDRWQCKPAFKHSENLCVKKTYAELIQTIDLLYAEAGRDSCDDFEINCSSDCNTSECSNACDAGKSECESKLSDACENAKSSCESECDNINHYKHRALCEEACSSGENSCD